MYTRANCQMGNDILYQGVLEYFSKYLETNFCHDMIYYEGGFFMKREFYV